MRRTLVARMRQIAPLWNRVFHRALLAMAVAFCAVAAGGTAQAASPVRRPSANGTARNRAEQDPVVRSIQEKFGAEIRTVIDYKKENL